MALHHVQRLIDELETAKIFPPNRELKYRKAIELFAAVRESDADLLEPTWWNQEYPDNRGYVIDPLGERISGTWADMLWGEEPQIEPAVKSDEKQLTALVGDNDLPATLPWAEEMCSSEGEVWSRIVSVPDIDSAQIEWHSRLNVIPLFIGRKLAAAAVFSVIDQTEDGKQQTLYVEYHTDGLQINRLYIHEHGKGLGDPVSLETHADTAALQPEWRHNLPMLVDRVHNKLGRDWRCGTSDFKGVLGLLLSLNEITNIGQENARLTAKQKVVIPQRFLDEKGRLPRGAEILIASEVDQDPDKIKNEFAMIEWEFDADAIIKYKADLTDTILTRARVAPQLVGRHTETAQTGPALRARLVDTLLAAQTKGKIWDHKLPTIISVAQQVEAKSVAQGGVAKSWTSPKKEPIIKRKSPLPEDPDTKSTRVVTETNAKIRSRQTAVEELNPTWGPDRVEEEMQRIQEEQQQALDMQKQLKDLNNEDNTGPSQSGQRTQSTGETVPDPASGTARKPGQRKPSTVPDPGRKNRN